MIPQHTQASIRSHSFSTYAFIALCSLSFINELTVPQRPLIASWGLIPASLAIYDPLSLLPVFTSMFLHGGLLHLAVNMWFLWMFGRPVERRIGSVRFILLFLYAGASAAAVQYLASPLSTIPVIGASGTVSGIIGAYFVWFSRSDIETSVVLSDSPLRLPPVAYLGAWIVLQLVTGIGSLPDIGVYRGGTAVLPHLAGFFFGWLVASYWRYAKRL